MSAESSVARPRSSALPWVLLLLVIVGGMAFFGLGFFEDTSASESTATSSITTVTGPGVLRRIQELSNLETMSYHIETVVTSTKEGNWYALWQDGQKGLFVANGTVTAGLDLSQLKASDVEVSDDGQKVRIKLPAAQILHVNLEETQAYNIETGAFGLVSLDPKLMEDAQKDARIQIEKTACASDILKMATDNGQRQVENLFSLMNVQVTVVPSSVPQCVAD